MTTINLHDVETITVDDTLQIEKNDGEVYIGSRINANIIDSNFNELDAKLEKQEGEIKLMSEKISQLAEIVNSLFKIIEG